MKDKYIYLLAYNYDYSIRDIKQQIAKLKVYNNRGMSLYNNLVL